MSRALVCVALVVLVCGCVSAVPSCPDVSKQMEPCVAYVTKKVPMPTPQCCAGVKTLNSQAASTADRQAACSCLKKTAQGLGAQLDGGRADGLPGKCGVKVNVPIGPNVDCSKIK